MYMRVTIQEGLEVMYMRVTIQEGLEVMYRRVTIQEGLDVVKGPVIRHEKGKEEVIVTTTN
jgi:hypothetical protein